MGVELPRIGHSRTTLVAITSLGYLRRLIVLNIGISIGTLFLMLLRTA
jgi:hypothetical protein